MGSPFFINVMNKSWVYAGGTAFKWAMLTLFATYVSYGFL